jgi:hypothetical protein
MNSDPRSSPPLLSAIIACPDNYQTVRRLTQYLRVQTIRDQIELVYIMPSAADFNFHEEDMAEMWGYQLVEIGDFPSLNIPRAKGIQVAKADIVVYTEDHCYPAADWAEHLVKAHEGPWAAVGPQIGLANAHSYTSWANFFIQYVSWMRPSEGGIAEDVPGHNSSYKRKILLEYGDELFHQTIFDTAMNQDLRRKGYELYVEPKALAFHLFMTNVMPFMRENFVIGRAYANTRSQSMKLWERILRFCLAPVVPFIRIKRVIDEIKNRGWEKQLLPGIIPPLFRGLVFSALGEAAGWLFGLGKSMEVSMELDFHRERFIAQNERDRVLSDELYDFSSDPIEPTISK